MWQKGATRWKDIHHDRRKETSGRIFPRACRCGRGIAELRAESEDHMSAARAQALRECNAVASHYPQYTWGDTEITEYRDCMAQHGQQE
jgi:hypothetical protein